MAPLPSKPQVDAAEPPRPSKVSNYPAATETETFEHNLRETLFPERPSGVATLGRLFLRVLGRA